MEHLDRRTGHHFTVLFRCKRYYSVGVFVAKSDWVFVDDWGCGNFGGDNEESKNAGKLASEKN